MVDDSNTRRRVRQHPSFSFEISTAATERESYNNRHIHSNDKKTSDDERCKDEEYDNNNYLCRSEIQTGAEDESGYKGVDKHYFSSSSRRHKQRSRQGRTRRKRRRMEREPPFFLLFLQVGAVLFMLSLASLYMYRGIQIYMNPSAGIIGDDDYDYEYVGGSSNGELDSDTDSLSESLLSGDQKPKHQLERTQPKLSDLLHVTEKKNKYRTEQTTRTMPPLPIFDLSESAEWDAFSFARKFVENHMGTDGENGIEEEANSKRAYRTRQTFHESVQNLKARFAELYGGENAARMLLDLGMTTFSASAGTGANTKDNNKNKTDTEVPIDLMTTACRLHRAKAENRSFSMAFGGYSVTAGRGNKHQDSFPFQLKAILEPIFVAAGFSNATKPALLVTNAAIGGAPSFPYGWCMAQFWGGGRNSEDINNDNANLVPDVVSWDFGMNEGSGGPEGLEAYIRQLISTYSSSLIPPKLIVKDSFTAGKRKEVLREYSSILSDPVVLHTDHAVDTMFKATKTAASDTNEESDSRRPPGFRKWRDWGAPKGAPGQAPHHPAVQEHRLNAWLLAMHFIVALEYMMVMENGDTKDYSSSSPHNWCPSRMGDDEAFSTTDYPFAASLPSPKSRKISNDTHLLYDSIFFGYPTAAAKRKQTHNNIMIQQEELSLSSTWRMNPVFCRTTFKPTVSGSLSGIVVNGTMGEGLDPILPKSQYYYNRGWTYDLSDAERKAKRKLNLYPDGLGFKDSKEAYYGIYESPPMTLFLPYESKERLDRSASSFSPPRTGDPASDWYESIVFCQVNDKNTFDSAFADASSCNFENDVGIRIGGIDILQNTTKMLRMIGSVYLGKPICKRVAIPQGANLTSHNTLLREGNGGLSSSSRGMIDGEGSSDDTQSFDVEQTGLLVEIFVSNPRIVHVHQACSLSHVVWEERHFGRLGLQIDHKT